MAIANARAYGQWLARPTCIVLAVLSAFPAFAEVGRDWSVADRWTPWAARIYTTCLSFEGSLWILSGNGSASSADVWKSSDGVSWTPIANNAAWSNYTNAAVYDDKMWVLNGHEVWKSADGITWDKVTASAPWNGSACLAFGGKFWVFGTRSGGANGTINDVWNSINGLEWTQVVNEAPWPGRGSLTAATYSGKMWVVGGAWSDDTDMRGLNDVWSSSDGLSWVQATLGAPREPRMGHTCVEYGGKLWLLGGYDYMTDIYYNDVWSSVDGASWVEATPSAPWEGRSGHATVVLASQIWIVGGDTLRQGAVNDVWRSTDGSNWNEAAPQAQWGGRTYHASVVHGDKMWVLGGQEGPAYWPHLLADTWSSSDGAFWTQSASLPFGLDHGSSLSFGDKLWLLGGMEEMGSYDGVQWSADGSSWALAGTLRPHQGAGHASVVFQGKMWIFGGYWEDPENSGYTDTNQWSTDGVSWTTTPPAPWAPRSGHTAVVFQDKVWVMGGAKNDVWESHDGLNWTQVTGSAPWSARSGHASVVADNRLWVLGGIHAGQEALNDAWSSPDGLNWTEVTHNAPWYPRWGHTSLVYDNKIWVMGGRDVSGTYYNDVWYSAIPEPRAEITGVTHNGWVAEGQSLTLTVQTTDTSGTVTYQWRKNGVDLPGETGTSLTITDLTADDAGTYVCRVTDESKAIFDTPGVVIRVFAAGALPVGGVWGVLVLLAGFGVVGVRGVRNDE